MKYYIAEFEYSANLAVFEGDKKGEATYQIKDRAAFREVFGSIWFGRSLTLRSSKNRIITPIKAEAITWLIEKVNDKVTRLQNEIEQEHKPVLKLLDNLMQSA